MSQQEFRQFESAVWRAYADLFVSKDEAEAAIAKARAEIVR